MELKNNFRHPNEKKAWEIAVTAFDDRNTVIYTQEIADAMGAAKDIFKSGDGEKARIAFNKAYQHEITKHKSPTWACSIGHDRTGRALVLIKALAMGIVSGSWVIDELKNYLPKEEL